MEEIELIDGTIVRVQPVPSMAISEVVDRNPNLADLPLPVEEIKGVAGVTKAHVRPGTGVYEEWLQENQRREKLRDQAFNDYTWDYGVVEWKLPGKRKFMSEPPVDWKFPEALLRYGAVPREGDLGRRIDYIKTTLFAYPKDQEKAQMAMYGITRPLTPEEVKSTRALFQGEEEGSADGETAQG